MNMPMLMAVKPTQALTLIEPCGVKIKVTDRDPGVSLTPPGGARGHVPRSECVGRSASG